MGTLARQLAAAAPGHCHGAGARSFDPPQQREEVNPMKRLLLALKAFMMCCAMGGAAAADIPLGPGDVVKVSVYGSPDMTTEARVSDSGIITFPLVGQVSVGGMAPADAEKKIARALEQGGFVKKPQVNLLVTSIQSQQVSVLGQVNRPGRYPLEAKRTLTDLLAAAGGISPEGGDIVSLIRKRKGNTTREEIDVVQMMKNGDTSKNYELAAGDVLFVERAPRFYIYGEVQRPGPVRLERQMTVTQALSAGGGLSLRGTERGIVIKRRDAQGNEQIVPVKKTDFVQADDVVYVKESWF
jgi:polysaccharide export outer membrane protein